jgi:hypothetical protein
VSEAPQPALVEPADEAPARTPERQVLAERIARRNEARAQHARLTEARERLNLRGLRDTRDEAAEALRQAETSARRQFVDRFLSGATAVDAVTVATATETLARAQQRYDEAAAADKLIEAELADVASHISIAQLGVARAVSDVLRTDSAVRAVLRRYEEMQQALADLAHCLGVIVSANGIPPDKRLWDIPGRLYPDPALAGFWAAAIEMLGRDADTELPG